MAIRIPVAALANFIVGSSVKQRSVLRNHKYPRTKDGKTLPPIVRYSETKAAIKKYHQSDNDINVLLKAVADLAAKRAVAKTEITNDGKKPDASRIDDNIRALNAYMKFFSKAKFEVLTTPKLLYKHGNVEVSASLDLFVKEGGSKKLIKLDLSATPPTPEVVEIILKVTAEAATAAELGIKPENVIYIDVERQQIYNGAKLGKKLKKEIDAACETIEDIWDRIKQQ